MATDPKPHDKSVCREKVAAAITAWLQDELERQNWNVPDRYAEWFDHGGMAAAVLAALELAEDAENDWPEIQPPAQPYYDRTDLRLAIAATREQVDEWSYDDDAHGYCHFRSLYAELVKAAEWARDHGYGAV